LVTSRLTVGQKEVVVKGSIQRIGSKPHDRNGGKGRNRSHQAQENVNSSLSDLYYMAWLTNPESNFSQNDWILDSGMTSHICMNKDAFIEYTPLNNMTITGIGPQGISALG
jgi:hypothetical protein